MSAVFPIEDDPRYRVSTATAGQTEFSVPFPFQERADILVWKEALSGLIAELVLDVDYTIAGAGNPAGGTVTLTVGAASGEKIYRIGRAVLERKTSVVRNGKFSSEALDDDLDRAIISLMEFRRDNDRAWKAGFGQQAGTINLGTPGRAAIFDVNGGLSPGPDADEIAGAQGYAELARDFANSAPGVEVQPGLYSSLHFADLAGAYAGNPVGVPVLPGAFSALHWADIAMQYANAAEDVEVAPGLYSARNYALKAAQFAASIEPATLVKNTAQVFTEVQKGQVRANIGASFLSGYRNKLINSSFIVRERAGGSPVVVSPGTTVWVADGWRLFNGTDVALNVFVRPVDGSYFSEYTPAGGINVAPVAAPTTGIVVLFQDVEDLRTIQNTGTLTCLASIGVTLIGGIERYFVSGGAAVSQSTAVMTGVSNTLAGHILLPPVPVSTPTGGSFLRTFLRWEPRSTAGVELSRIKLVAGDVTPEAVQLATFDERPVAVERRDAQRYFRRTTEGLSMTFNTTLANSDWVAVAKQHPTPMYATPTVALGAYSQALTNMSPGTPDVNWHLNITALDAVNYAVNLGAAGTPPTSGSYTYARRTVTFTADIAS